MNRFLVLTGPWSEAAFSVAAPSDGSVSLCKGCFTVPGADAIMKQIQMNSSKTDLVLGITSRAAGIEYQTNASVSTALAAGVAAMNIYFVTAKVMTAYISGDSMKHIIGSSDMEEVIKRTHLSRFTYTLMREELPSGSLNKLITTLDEGACFLETLWADNLQDNISYFLELVLEKFEALDRDA